MIELRDVSKVYQIGEERVRALDHASLHVRPHEFVSVIGPSGSGKSTLMNIIGCLDTADAGEYLLDGTPIEAYTENELARVRNIKIGFVFQSFNLISKLSAEENVELPLIYQGVRTGNLDSHTGGEIMDMFAELHEQGNTIVLITHDNDIARRAKRVVHILDGRLTEVTL